MQYILDLASSLPEELAVVLLSLTPFAELRFSIPFAIKVFGFSPLQAIFWSTLGDIIPAIVIVYYLGPISRFFMKRSKLATRFFQRLFKKTRQRFDEDYVTLGKFALLVFVAMPLPGFGAWSGAILAWLFAMRKSEAVLFIFLGVLISAFLIAGLSLGFFTLFKF